jgi:hypothetical protein
LLLLLLWLMLWRHLCRKCLLLLLLLLHACVTPTTLHPHHTLLLLLATTLLVTSHLHLLLRRGRGLRDPTLQPNTPHLLLRYHGTAVLLLLLLSRLHWHHAHTLPRG